jgi:hypothetical protein
MSSANTNPYAHQHYKAKEKKFDDAEMLYLENVYKETETEQIRQRAVSLGEDIVRRRVQFWKTPKGIQENQLNHINFLKHRIQKLRNCRR